MAISDFVIITLNDSKRIQLFEKNIEIISFQRNENSPRIYKTGFFVAQCLLGRWYAIFPEETQMYSNPFFSVRYENHNPHIVERPFWSETIRKLIKDFLKKSDSEIIAIFFRLDDPKKEVVHNVLSYERFMSDLEHSRLCYNELYFISMEESMNSKW